MLKFFATRLLPALAAGLLATATATAQSVGIGTPTPNAAAALDITATGKGLLIPRMDSASRVGIASPPTGLMVFQTDGRQGFWYYAGGAWLFLPDKTRSGDNLGNHLATQNLNLQGNALTGTGSSVGTAVGVGVTTQGGLNLGQNTTGNNVYLGYQGGAANTTGTQNYFGGYQAGAANTSGSYNTFGGYFSGLANTTGNDNTFIGNEAGRSTISGTRNTFLGSVTGASNVSGSNNTFSGYSVAYGSTGDNNTFTGFNAGGDNISGSGNTALGYNAGPTVGSGALTNATAIGNNARVGQSNSLVLGGTGADAVRVGIGTTAPTATLDVRGDVAVDAAGANNGTFTGQSVLRFGANSGEGLASARPTGSPNQYGLDFYTGFIKRLAITNAGNVGIGTDAPTALFDVAGRAHATILAAGSADVTGSVRVDEANVNSGSFNGQNGLRFGVGNSGEGIASARATGSPNLGGLDFYTGYAKRLSIASAGNVGIGTDAPAATLHVAGPTSTVRLEGLAGTAGRYVTVAADGTLGSTASAAGDNLGNGLATTDVNLQGNKLTGTGASISGVGVGVRADGGLNLGQNNGRNVRVGYESGSGGNYNIFVGVATGQDNTTGSQNQFIGDQAGQHNTTGILNTFVGDGAGVNNAGGSANFFGGSGAGFNNTGNSNTFVGISSGGENTTGSNNTALGNNAGPATGSGTLTNATALGNQAKVSQSNSLVLGGTGNDAVSVGIGTTAPAATLDVVGSTRVSAGLSVDVAGTNNGGFADAGKLRFGDATSGEGLASARTTGSANRFGLDFYTSFSKRLSIDNTGNVGVGPAAPSSTLQVQGTLAVGVVANLNGSASPGVLLDAASYYGLNPGTGTNYQLPAASTCVGRIYYLRNNSSTVTATLNTSGGALFFDAPGTVGVTTYGLNGSGSSKTVTVISDGTNWTVIRAGN